MSVLILRCARTCSRVDLLINSAGAQHHWRRLAQSTSHQETPPTASGGLLSAPHPADALSLSLSPWAFVFQTRRTCSLPSPLSDSFMHIACARVSPFCRKGAYSLPTTKTVIRSDETAAFPVPPVRLVKSEVKTAPGASLHRGTTCCLLIPTDWSTEEQIIIKLVDIGKISCQDQVISSRSVQNCVGQSK